MRRIFIAAGPRRPYNSDQMTLCGLKKKWNLRWGLSVMNIKAEIRKYIIENFLYGSDDNTLSDDVSFLENGIIDSTGVLELVSFVQETFGIKVKDEELIPNNFDSLSKLEAFIVNKKQISEQTQVGAGQTVISPVS